MPAITGFSHVTFTVTDLRASVEWYERVLGVQKLFEGEENGMTFLVTIEPGSNVLLTFRHHESTVTEPFDETRVGLDHIAFHVADRAEMQAWLQKLDELGVDHSEIKDVEYGSVLTFRDPDNIQLEFFTLPS